MSINQNIYITVDAIIIAEKDNDNHVLLIERGSDPFKGSYAFPGGFVEEDEDLQTAAMRELKEETGIDTHELTQFKAVGTPGRDPRGRTVTVVYFGCISQEQMEAAEGADDAASAKWFPINELPDLAFDHQRIMRELKEYLKLN